LHVEIWHVASFVTSAWLLLLPSPAHLLCRCLITTPTPFNNNTTPLCLSAPRDHATARVLLRCFMAAFPPTTALQFEVYTRQSAHPTGYFMAFTDGQKDVDVSAHMW